MRAMLPFYAAMWLALMAVTYVPGLSLWLPVETGQIKRSEVEKLEFLKRTDSPTGSPLSSP